MARKVKMLFPGKNVGRRGIEPGLKDLKLGINAKN